VPELVVTDDVPGEAVRRFLQAAPIEVALAGGSTPRPFYERLAQADPGHDWSVLRLYPTDERCVPPNHPDSNARMIEEALVSRLPPTPRGPNLHRFPPTCDPERAERELRLLAGWSRPRLDLAILGLGQDGHTASLFPGDPALEETERWVARVRRPDHDRLTLTLPVLSSAPTAIFLVSGGAKRTALRSVMDGADVPAARVRSRDVVVIADRAAAEGLA
jgi:6-phosphogluconolactonase